MTRFLEWLKPYYDHGFIQLCAATATVCAVIVALWPHFNRWSRKAKLNIEIPRAYAGERIRPQSVGGGAADDIYAIIVRLRVRNVGETAAIAVRLTATDFYLRGGHGKSLTCSIEDLSELDLPSEGKHLEHLPPGLAARCTLCGRSVHGSERSPFVFGSAPGSTSITSIGGVVTKFNFDQSKVISPDGIHLIRIIANATDITPSEHFIALEVTENVSLRLATRQEKRAIKKADSTRAALEISAG